VQALKTDQAECSVISSTRFIGVLAGSKTFKKPKNLKTFFSKNLVFFQP